MNPSKKSAAAKIAIAALSVLVVVLAVALTVFISKSNAFSSAQKEQEKQYQSVMNDNNALKSQHESEKESYENLLSEKEAGFSKEKKNYEKKIADLNQQISLKKKAQAATDKAPVLPPPATQARNTSGKTVYLTFDDGPSQRTPEVLKILKDNGVKATFFVVNGKKNNHYMKDIVAQGHTIALHSYTHDYKKIYTSEQAYFNDLQQISDLVYAQTGVRSNLIRFPGGGSNTVSRKYDGGVHIMSRLTKKVQEMGYSYFDWNISSGDASYPSPSVSKIIQNCQRIPKNNTVIVLMHDAGDKKNTVAALPEVIRYYKSAGCKFATLSADVPAVHQRVAN